MKEKPMGELEEQVMQLVWKFPDSSIKDIHKELQKTRNLAYTTVATILERLFEKGIVAKTEKDGVNVFRANVSRERYSKFIAKHLIKKFVYSFGDAAITSFAESIDELPQDKRDHFKMLLNKHLKHE